MTKKHFIVIATALKAVADEYNVFEPEHSSIATYFLYDKLVRTLADKFKQDNPRFDYD
ncbi:MAG: hypothetical protein IH843_03605, partial [Thaumarchaeota archaeon]|nr:hypothetical protein [Nitrososphaerota archaeon]